MIAAPPMTLQTTIAAISPSDKPPSGGTVIVGAGGTGVVNFAVVSTVQNNNHLNDGFHKSIVQREKTNTRYRQ